MTTGIDQSFEPEPANPPPPICSMNWHVSGYRPFSDEADGRPLPEARIAAGAIADIFDAMVSTLKDTSSNPISKTCSGPSLMSSTVPANGSNASWMIMKWRSGAVSANRMARKCARSNLSGCCAKARP